MSELANESVIRTISDRRDLPRLSNGTIRLSWVTYCLTVHLCLSRLLRYLLDVYLFTGLNALSVETQLKPSHQLLPIVLSFLGHQLPRQSRQSPHATCQLLQCPSA